MKVVNKSYFSFGVLTREQWALSLCVVFSIILLNLQSAKSVFIHLWNLISGLLQFTKLKPTAKKAAAIKIANVKISDEERLRHTVIVGTTGSGKSVLIDQLMSADINRGYGLIVIDAKGDRSGYSRLKEMCRDANRLDDLHLLSANYLEESVRWNPCRLGSQAELASKFYASCKYEHHHFAKAAESALIRAFKAVDADNVKELYLSEVVKALKETTKNGADEHTKGLYFDFSNLSESEWAPVLGLEAKDGLDKEVSLLDVIKKNEILYVDLPTEGKQVQSARMGALILQELTLISGMRKRFPEIMGEKPFPVYIDEFDAFATEPFVSFLNKGRSSGFMIHMAHQTSSDLQKVSKTFEGQVYGNCNNQFVFRLNNSEDAEKVAKGFGTKNSLKRTNQITDGTYSGSGSEREVQEFKIHPDVIKSLNVGTCVLSIKSQKFLEVIKIPIDGNGRRSLRPTVREAMGVKMVEPSDNGNLEQIKDVDV